MSSTTEVEGALVDEIVDEPSRGRPVGIVDVDAAAERIYAMIQFTKEYENVGVSTPRWHNLSDLVNGEVEDVPQGRIKVINDIPADLELYADPLVSKVFHNLISNAVKHVTIEAQAGSVFTVSNCVIEASDGGLNYYFVIRNGAAFTMTDSCFISPAAIWLNRLSSVTLV